MLITLARALIIMERRRVMQIVPESLMKLWNQWQLRTMILLSLSLQIVLIIFGKRRRLTARYWVRILVWMTYLAADWAATVSLGILSNNQGNSADTSPDAQSAITTFWAPFLLLHLGGPDSITAYSLEDNELWLRHLLGLCVHVGVAFYIFLKSWTGANLMFSYQSIPIFVAGIIKYGERTWALRSASSNYFKDSLLPAPEPGPDYAKFMEEYSFRISQGYTVGYGKIIEAPRVMVVGHGILSDAIYLHEAHFLFKMFRQLYADLILSFHEAGDSWRAIANKSPVDAFKVIEVELGFMYDVLHTKATIVYSRMGTILRSISFFSSISALLAFWVFIDRRAYSSTDIIITNLLLVGAVILEFYATIVLIFSDWAMLWLTGLKKPWANSIYRAISSSRFTLVNDKKWSRSMAQFNLIGFCLKEKATKCQGVFKLLGIYEMLEKNMYKTSEGLNIDLKELILQQLEEKERKVEQNAQIKQICAERGDHVLARNNCLNKLGWSITEIEFDHSLLLWHIATDLCYYSDLDKYQDFDIPSSCKTSKSLSDYMLYLLVMCPFMLPKGIGEIRFRDTCAEAITFFKKRKQKFKSGNKIEACMLLLQVSTAMNPSTVKGDRSKSILFDGCRLAKALQSLVTEERWDNEEKWKMISHVWAQMLFYAANKCGWKQHAQQLRHGGELLIHVCLLMTHLGLCEQFQISAGHARMRISYKMPNQSRTTNNSEMPNQRHTTNDSGMPSQSHTLLKDSEMPNQIHNRSDSEANVQ